MSIKSLYYAASTCFQIQDTIQDSSVGKLCDFHESWDACIVSHNPQLNYSTYYLLLLLEGFRRPLLKLKKMNSEWCLGFHFFEFISRFLQNGQNQFLRITTSIFSPFQINISRKLIWGNFQFRV